MTNEENRDWEESLRRRQAELRLISDERRDRVVGTMIWTSGMATVAVIIGALIVAGHFIAKVWW